MSRDGGYYCFMLRKQGWLSRKKKVERERERERREGGGGGGERAQS